MNGEEKKEFEQLKLTVQGMEETINKLSVCALVMKDMAKQFMHVDLDKLIEEKMKEGGQNGR